jgi:hypothetical protein
MKLWVTVKNYTAKNVLFPWGAVMDKAYTTSEKPGIAIAIAKYLPIASFYITDNVYIKPYPVGAIAKEVIVENNLKPGIYKFKLQCIFPQFKGEFTFGPNEDIIAWRGDSLTSNSFEIEVMDTKPPQNEEQLED